MLKKVIIRGVIKSLIILILLFALCAGSFLSRPKTEDFKPFLEKQYEASATGPLGKLMADAKADAFANSCQVTDRFLYVAVTKDGKSVYTGAFSHWFGNDSSGK